MIAEILSLTAAVLAAAAVILLVAERVSRRRARENTRRDQGQIDRLERELATLSEQSRQLIDALGREFSNSRNENARRFQEQREDTSRELKQMTDTLSRSLAGIRNDNTENARRQSQVLSESVARMAQSNEQKLEQMRATVDEKLTATLNERLDSSFQAVAAQLESVNKSLGEMRELSSGVTNNIHSLNRVLTNVKARGTWAEVQLEGLLEQTIPHMYDKNVATNQRSNKRVEFAVRIPESDGSGRFTYLPIDSKFPMEDYSRLCDAADRGDAAAVEQYKKALEQRVREEAKAVREYIHVPDTTPFAILYLATEGLYAEITSSHSGLPEQLIRENIMLAGPMTITALLNSLSIGFRAVTINEKANEIRALLGAVKLQYEKFGGLLEKARKKIDEAGGTIDDALRRNTLISRKLKNADEIDAARAQELLGLPDTFAGETDDTEKAEI